MSTGAKRKSRSRVLVADTSGSKCFADLRWSKGSVFATFARDNSQYEFPMTKKEAKEWFASDLGEYFNAEVR